VGTAHLPPTLAKPLADLKIPSTVQAVLASRIDRLPAEEKDFLQTLSVIGKEFPWSLLKQVIAKPEEELHSLLSHLQAAEFIYEQPAFPEVEYTFKHALTQEVAYGSLLIERRKSLHERTAQATEALYHSRLEDHYGELAHHYSRSGNTQKAVEYLGLAGQQATQRSANAEAISHLTTALELLKTLPDTPERSQQELTLQIALGIPLIAAKGYGVPEVEKAYTRARELCQQVGEAPPQLFSVLWGLFTFYYSQAEYETTRELGKQCLSLAQSVQDPDLLLEAHLLQGFPLYSLGEFAPAREQYEQGLALYDPQQHRSHAFLYGQDPGVCCGVYTAYALWHLGYPDQGLKKIHEAVTLAQELSHPFSLALALNWAAISHQFRREGHLAQERAEAAITLSTEQGFPFCVAWGTILRGWVLAEQGQEEEGIAQMRQGIAAWRATGAEVWRPYFLALLAEAYGKVGHTEEGLSVVAEALALVDKTGERFYEAELYRLKGELTLQQFQVSGSKFQVENSSESRVRSPAAEAEACFWKAIEIARKQQAKSWELRAATSLARLWQQQGKPREAHEMLAEIYGWFTEGFDTKDLQDAKALLEELESTAGTRA
jgi:predicted ATPase